jgi:rod shape-determining protein MreC
MARRAVAAVLILVSLALLTVYLRESDEGGLHAAQRVGLAILAPFEVAGERIARPFQDAYGYVSDLVSEKESTDRLEARIEQLQEELRQAQAASSENQRLRELLAFVDGPRFPANFDPVTTRVIAQPSNAYNQRVLVAAGSAEGVKAGAPVVTGDGLVGVVTKVTSGYAQVTLLTDPSMFVSAQDADTEARGDVRASASAGAGLILDRVDKELVVEPGDTVITSGWSSGKIASLYPFGIPIGEVTSVGRQDIELYMRIQVEPFVDFDSLSEVVVLVAR